MYICDRCQMGYQVGMNVSHSHRRTKTKSIPNLHVITVKIEGQSKTMRLCTKCTRIIRKMYPRVTEEAKKEVISKAKFEKLETPEVKSETPKEEVVPAE